MNFPMAGATILTTLGYLVLAHLDRRTIWAIPALVVAAAAVLAKFNMVWVSRFDRGMGHPRTAPRPEPAPCWPPELASPDLPRGDGGVLPHLRRADSRLARISPLLEGNRRRVLVADVLGPWAETVTFSVVMGVAIVAAVAGILLRRRYTPALVVFFPLSFCSRAPWSATQRQC